MGWSPYLFALYVDSIVDKVKKEYFLGCYVKWQCVTILLYADDIIIIAPTVTALQTLLQIVELELEINSKRLNSVKITRIIIKEENSPNRKSVKYSFLTSNSSLLIISL